MKSQLARAINSERFEKNTEKILEKNRESMGMELAVHWGLEDELGKPSSS